MPFSTAAKPSELEGKKGRVRHLFEEAGHRTRVGAFHLRYGSVLPWKMCQTLGYGSFRLAKVGYLHCEPSCSQQRRTVADGISLETHSGELLQNGQGMLPGCSIPASHQS